MKKFESQTACETPPCRLSMVVQAKMLVARARSVLHWLAAVAMFAASSHAMALAYRFTDLGIGSANDINEVGQVVGQSGGHATLWDHGSKTDLGTIGGTSSIAYGINNVGQVVGQSQIAGDGARRPTLWDRGSITELGTLGGQSTSSGAALGINDTGDIVGRSTIVHPDYPFWRATLWHGAPPAIDLHAPTNYWGQATAINAAGQMVGGGLFDVNPEYAVETATLWTGTKWMLLDDQTSRYNETYAFDINNTGQVVGQWVNQPGRNGLAVTWNDAVPTFLGSGAAYGINDAGQIVGASSVGATLWNGTVATDLNSFLKASERKAGWFLASASEINESGWIIGTASNSLTGEQHAYLLSAVPESGSYALMLAGLGALGFAVRRRQWTAGC